MDNAGCDSGLLSACVALYFVLLSYNL